MSGSTSAGPGRPDAPNRPRCRTVAEGGLRTLNYVRDLAPILVEERLGPPDLASVPTPSEILLAALGSCLASRIHANAMLGNIVVHRLELDADMATGAIRGAGIDIAPPPGLDVIRIRVHLHANAPRGELRSLIAHSLMLSPVANTLHGPVDLEVALAEPAGLIS